MSDSEFPNIKKRIEQVLLSFQKYLLMCLMCENWDSGRYTHLNFPEILIFFVKLQYKLSKP